VSTRNGGKRAKLFQKRLFVLENALNLDELRTLPGHYHRLTEIRRGQWACSLDQPFRLVFDTSRSPLIAEGAYGLVESELTVVNIIEIVNYHGK